MLQQSIKKAEIAFHCSFYNKRYSITKNSSIEKLRKGDQEYEASLGYIVKSQNSLSYVSNYIYSLHV